MTDNGMKEITAILSGRRPFTDETLDLLDAIAGTITATVEAIARNLFHCCRGHCLAPLTPHNSPVERAINVGELMNIVELIACNSERLVRAPEQLNADWLTINLKAEFPV
jgi:hypothetical protein